MTKYITGIPKEDADATKKPKNVFYSIKYTTDRKLWKIYPEVKKICIEFDTTLTRLLMPELKRKTLSYIYIKENNIHGDLNYREFEFKFILQHNNNKYIIYITKKDLYELLTDIATEFAVNNIRKPQSDATITFVQKCPRLSLCNKLCPIKGETAEYSIKYINMTLECSSDILYEEAVIQIRHDT